MGFPLDSYEIYMVFCMIFQKDFYGVSMGFKIDFYGIPMVFPLDSYGIPSAFLWDFNDMSIYGISMGLITLGLQSKVIQLKSTGNHLKTRLKLLEKQLKAKLKPVESIYKLKANWE